MKTLRKKLTGITAVICLLAGLFTGVLSVSADTPDTTGSTVNETTGTEDTGAARTGSETQKKSWNVKTGEYGTAKTTSAADGKKTTSTEDTKPSEGTAAVKVKALVYNATGTFRITVSGLSNLPAASAVIVPVWCAADQSDIYWYTAQKQGTNFVVNGSLANHKYHSGTYKADVYEKTASGAMAYKGGASMEVKLGGTLKMTDNFAGQAGKEQTEYTGRLTELAFPGSPASMTAAVWSDKGGQDDLKWYPMTREADGSYTFQLKINDHKSAGSYYVDVYGVTQNGDYVFLARSRDVMIDEPKYDAAVTTEDLQAEAGTFRVRVSNLKSASGVSSVNVPVWTDEGGQDDLKWYKANQEADGSWTATVSAGNHKNRSGLYRIDVYATGGNGIFGFADGTTLEFKLSDNAIMVSGGVDDVNRTISIRNPTQTPVKFAVWSTDSGQQDLAWVTAQDQGDGIWAATVQCNNFLCDGQYAVHAYGGDSCIKTSVFTWNAKSTKAKLNSNQGMFDLAQSLYSDTQYLILVNRGLHRVAIYQGSQGNWTEIKYWPCVVGKPSTPTPAGTYKIKGRFDWFGDGHKCWWATQIEGYYYFHSVLYYWDNAPRQILDGTMDAAASMGCVRLEEPNAYWIYTQIPRGTTVHIFN